MSNQSCVKMQTVRNQGVYSIAQRLVPRENKMWKVEPRIFQYFRSKIRAHNFKNPDMLHINILDVLILLQAVRYLAKQEMGQNEEVVLRISTVTQMDGANQHSVPTQNLVQ